MSMGNGKSEKQLWARGVKVICEVEGKNQGYMSQFWGQVSVHIVPNCRVLNFFLSHTRRVHLLKNFLA